MRKKSLIYYCTISCLCCLLFPVAGSAAVEVKITGIDDPAALTNVQTALTLVQKKDDPEGDKVQLADLLAVGHRKIVRALEPYGYYHPQITHTVARAEATTTVHYQVIVGAPVVIQTLDIVLSGEGQDDPKMRALFKAVPLTLHKRLDQTGYKRFKQDIVTLAASRGYIDAKFTQHQITIDTASNTARIALHFASGARYRFGPVTFSKVAYDESFLRRFLPFTTGEPYSERKLLDLQQTLSNHYFSFVQVAPVPGQAVNLQIPINITLVSRKPIELGMGAGLGTDTGFRLLFNGHWYRATTTGHQLSSLLHFSQYSNSARLGYIIPGPNPVEDQFVLSASYDDERPRGDVSNSQTAQLSAKYLTGNPLSGWLKTFAVNAHIERYDNVRQIEHAALVYPEIGFERVKADSRFNTTRGYGMNFSTRGALDGVGSSVSFLQASLRAKGIHSFSKTQRILLRSELGVTLSDEHDDVPRSLRFFAGGDKSVRGFGYETLAPEKRDNRGKKLIVGGAHLLVGSIEFEQKVAASWSVAGFYDIGSAFDHFNAMDQGRSVGVGMRWHSPIGPVRLDFAHPLTRSDQVIRIHFSIGPDL